MTDMGIYPIQLCQWVFQKEPISIKASGKLNNDNVDVEIVAELNYGDNKVGRVKSSIVTTWPHEATIVGTKGTIKVNQTYSTFELRLRRNSSDPVQKYFRQSNK